MFVAIIWRDLNNKRTLILLYYILPLYPSLMYCMGDKSMCLYISKVTWYTIILFIIKVEKDSKHTIYQRSALHNEPRSHNSTWTHPNIKYLKH